MALVFAVMHLYTVSFLYFFKTLVLINRRNGPRYQHVLALCTFLTGAIPKGLILRRKKKFDVCVCFLYICVRTELLFLDNLWFDDLRAGEKRKRIEHCF